ncbi:hypothetical protein Psch_02628 [Pelotomaculum schinkii]|uniref:TerB-C domain-containing protein n=1 Tax=Pelotomaculum schinkii TaxID=78350 RepID=A0A4Y7R9V7_9FIRM|nr:TerB N-terminal domain-containing protein [Pelotomaculum schinkii]TEB05587.1 hypothetical protein Psch_02628 [Pelotomaculum schinkii]
MLSFISSLFAQKPIIFELSYSNNTAMFTLRAGIKGKPYPIGEALSRFSRLHFPISVKDVNGAMQIKPQDVEAVRAWLFHLTKAVGEKHAIYRCDALSEAIKQVDIPSSFILSFSEREGGVFCAPPEGVTVLAENGWFLSGDTMWHVAVGDAVSQSLHDPVVGHQLVELLSKGVPALINSGIRVECPYSYDRAPYLWISIKDVTKDHVALQREMHTGELRPVYGAQDYVWDGNTLRPKQYDALVERIFAQGDSVVLTGDDIPKLVMAAFSTWKSFLKGEIQRLLELHTVYENGELLLNAYSEQHNGIGKAYARAEVWAGGKRFSAAQLSRAILPDNKFVQTDDGWFSIELLEKLGLGRMGRLADGCSIEKPFTLSAEELLSCGGDRLSGPWKRMITDSLIREQSGKTRAYSHLRFLAEWGLSGGLNGSGVKHINALLELIHELSSKSPQLRLLIVGKKQRLDEIYTGLQPLSPLWLDGSKKDSSAPVQSSLIIIATTNSITKNEVPPSLKFDILVLIEPDIMTKSNSTKIFASLEKLKARIRIALYADMEYMKRYQTQLVQHELLGITRWSVTDCLIINPFKPLPHLPKPYVFKQVALKTQQTFAEIQLQGEPAPNKGVPIPQRTELTTNIGFRPQINISFRTGEQYFVEQAQNFSTKTVKQARFTPFMTYWPTYESMTSTQSQWYFYWRARVRCGEYPNTDLSYIFLYVYELINLVGCESPLEGYQKLMNVWRAYRALFPKLDRYLAAWVNDFILAHDLEVPADEISNMCGCPVGQNTLDNLLLMKFGERPLRIDLPLLSQAANYDITRSKFYQSVHASLCDEYIPKAVALVDAFLEKKQGRRIVEMFNPGYVQRERYLFQSALYAGEPRTIKINAIPLSTHSPLRDFLAQVIRHTENKLREIKDFSSKLRGIDLEEDLCKLIDAYMEREFFKKREVQEKITIDANKLARAAAEAEETQRMLMIENTEEQMDAHAPDLIKAMPEDTMVTSIPVRPDDTPDGLLTDLAVVAELLSQLDESECLLINTLSKHGWEMTSSALQAIMPSCMTEEVVDQINEKALRILGSLLIVQESQLHLIDEDYRDELEFLRTYPAQEAQVHAVWNADGLDAEWRELCQKLSPCQLDTLYAMVRGASRQDLQSIAEKAETMVEPVLDSINEAAIETVGDLLIEDGAVLEEYFEPVKRLFSVEDE